MKSTRKITAMLLFFSAICMFTTLLVLIFTPYGWEGILGISRADFFSMHRTFGVILALLIINHIRLNFRQIRTYMKNAQGRHPSAEMAIALAIVIVIAVGAVMAGRLAG